VSLTEDEQKCLDKLSWATQQLAVEVSEAELVPIAQMIIECMTGKWRCFHTPSHVFSVANCGTAVEVLAGLFHDVVYVQIDQGVNLNLSYYLAPFVKEHNGQLMIREQGADQKDLILEIVLSIFGLVSGQTLSPSSGQNEFLSALAGAKILESFLPPKIIAQIVACIEATIPFRGNFAESLCQRLEETNENLSLGITEEEIEQTIRSAVRLANRDVVGFAATKSVVFLDNTWNLLPETNHNLYNHTSYTITEYRAALEKTEAFLNLLVPEAIFPYFRGEPNPETYQELLAITRHNLAVGRLYLLTKIVTLSLFEAISLRIGKDVALSSLVGELPSQQQSNLRLGHFIHNDNDVSEKNHQFQTAIENEVLSLLEEGRSRSFGYDIRESPMSAFLVRTMGFEEVRKFRNLATEFFQQRISGEEFISKYPPHIVQKIIAAIVQVMDIRKNRLLGKK
jgi:hypothetical protein